MSGNPALAKREGQLLKQFPLFIKGDRNINTRLDGQHFLQAFCLQSSPSTAVERVVSTHEGIAAIRGAFRIDFAVSFTQDFVVPFLLYLSHPSVKALFDGSFLRQIIEAIVEPPTFWVAFLKCYEDNKLTDGGVQALAWLGLELISQVPPISDTITKDIRSKLNNGSLLKSPQTQTRTYAYRIQKALQLLGSDHVDVRDGPGGRHDNDFADFRLISLYPTRDELNSTEKPFYQTLEETFEASIETRARAHIENQFRILREEMVWEFREDLQVSTGRLKGSRRQPLMLGNLKFLGIVEAKYANARGRLSLLFSVGTGLKRVPESNPEANNDLVKRNALGAFLSDNDVVAFGSVKSTGRLKGDWPTVEVEMTDMKSLRAVLAALTSGARIRFSAVGTPVFAYESILERLKEMVDLPLEKPLLRSEPTNLEHCPAMKSIIDNLERKLHMGKFDIDTNPLDRNQLLALIYALKISLSVIQGPPGTGKSYVGSLFVKTVLGAGKRVLLLTYTNHSLDDFLIHLTKIGVEAESMVRLGSKPSEKTAHLSLKNQRMRCSRSTFVKSTMQFLKNDISTTMSELETAGEAYRRCVSDQDILEHLEFNEPTFYEAFRVPVESEGGFQYIGAKGKKLEEDYLIQQWKLGNGPKGFPERLEVDGADAIWKLPLDHRLKKIGEWVEAVRETQLDEIVELGHKFQNTKTRLEKLVSDNNQHTLQQKKLIACTTTAAAQYQDLIKAADLDIMIVEEAGEILEAHILAALSPTVKQLVLIGDHKQLRPKINNYSLTVESGEGYDLNRSLFERLILAGYPYKVLATQHRMHPDISRLARALTYPDLEDGKRTLERPPPRGIQGRVIFINHESQEDDLDGVTDRRDAGSKSSKHNKSEALVVLSMVKYLAQQGYKTENVVVLTPYLGQLRMLREQLRTSFDPVLNDLDAFELRHAGLLGNAASKLGKGNLRLSTVDNYQGEESDIVLVSLTRSNNRGDIGFLWAPERLNVLLTRARDATVLIGNMETFMASRKGKGLWTKFFDLLKETDSLHDGFPVRCEQHPSTTAILKEPGDFEKHCPDGGCSELCGVQLSCGQHNCVLRCHRLKDHSAMGCHQIVKKTCDRGHSTKVVCTERQKSCGTCKKINDDARRRLQRNIDLEKARQAKQAQYERELQKIQDDLDHEKRLLNDAQAQEQHKTTLAQQQAELKSLQARRKRAEAQKLAAEEAKAAAGSATTTAADPKKTPLTKSRNGPLGEPQNAAERWEQMKEHDHVEIPAVDSLMEMIGLESVKEIFLSIVDRVDTAIRQEVSLSEERFSCTLLGNPGTGKTTVARKWADFLTSVGVIPGSKFVETTGSKVATMGVQGCQSLIDDLLNDGGGVIFIDEAYQLSSGNNPGGKAVLDFLLAEVENLRGKIVFVLAGYTKQMETFFAHNPGLPSRFPIEMKFEDYTDDELLQILALKIEKKFKGSMKAQDGLDGLFCRIVARRVGRGRGREGFGNARDVENTLDKAILPRQTDRLTKTRRAGKQPEYFLLTKEDLIGPEPGPALLESKAWRELQCLIGLRSVKEAVKSLVDSIQANYLRELAEEPLIGFSLNKVFLGSPGTGKTTVAKLYGQILVDLGLLSNGEVIVKNPSDFVGSVIGGSEQQTKGILAATQGKVLVIDEAYGLYGGSAGTGSGASSDPFRQAVVDTIVAEVQSTPGEDRCVLLLGYKTQMEEMFQNVNPGLSRRFPIASAFTFEDFDEAELSKILNLKLNVAGYKVTDDGKKVALEVLERARNRPNFGNAGEVDILLNDAKARHQKRLSQGSATQRSLLEPVDFDEDFDRAIREDTNARQLFQDTVGCEALVAKLEEYQGTVRAFKEHGMDPKKGIPFNFLFRGPPGTGKTSTARKMGKLYYDMGFLSTVEVVDCSATDLIGQHVGQTGPKVQQLLDKALGRVLFIDEAYRLGEGHFAKEAVDELVDCVTKPKYQGKMIIILAGYDEDINRLLTVNPGMSSRFPEVVDFASLKPMDCMALLVLRLSQQGKEMVNSSLDISRLENPSDSLIGNLLDAFKTLASLDGWANARDVETLAKSVFGHCIKNAQKGQQVLVIDETMVQNQLSDMLKERTKRAQARSRSSKQPDLEDLMRTLDPPLPASRQSQTATATATAENHDDDDDDDEPEPLPPQNPSRLNHVCRDAGVSDEDWEQLQRDKQTEKEREKQFQQLKAKSKAKDLTEEARRRILEELLREEEERKKEEERKQKLKAMGRCPAGYEWIKQSGGYTCSAGGHYVDESVLL